MFFISFEKGFKMKSQVANKKLVCVFNIKEKCTQSEIKLIDI